MIKKILELFSKNEVMNKVKKTPEISSLCPSKVKKGQVLIKDKREYVVKGIYKITHKRYKSLDFGRKITIHLMNTKSQYETSIHYSLNYKPTCCIKLD